MSEASLITDEMRRAIGTESEVTYHEVEKGAIGKILRAMEDTNPLWTDPKVANRSRYRGIVAPPAYLISIPAQIPEVEIPPSLTRGLAGGNEWQFFSPVRPGDVIVVKSKVYDIFEKQGKQGKMLFLVYEVTYARQNGEKIAINRVTRVRY